jgi:UDP-N-acetylmuramyl pentapeptide phosphotransferase/UDP-N-acetylglucosamine-1-phosphate transferase
VTATSALVAAALLAAGLSAGVAEWFRRWAVGRAVLDIPNARSSHAVPTPRGGGVGILVGFVAGMAFWVAAGGVLPPRAIGWLAGALLVAAVSFVDDLRSLPASLRLATHLLGGAILTIVGVQERELPLVVAIPLAFLWITLLTNIFNFMDGIDGLATAQAIVAGATYAVAGALVGNPLVGAAGALLAAASAGFLVHNLPPARIFMGDVASTFLGFNFAGLALLGNLGVGGGLLPVEFGVVVMAPFLFDSVITLLRRIVRGERWFEAHRSHYYQRLVQAGVSHGRVCTLYATMALAAAAAALIGLALGDPMRQVLAVMAFMPMLGIVALVWRLERWTVGAVKHSNVPTYRT